MHKLSDDQKENRRSSHKTQEPMLGFGFAQSRYYSSFQMTATDNVKEIDWTALEVREVIPGYIQGKDHSRKGGPITTTKTTEALPSSSWSSSSLRNEEIWLQIQ